MTPLQRAVFALEGNAGPARCPGAKTRRADRHRRHGLPFSGRGTAIRRPIGGCFASGWTRFGEIPPDRWDVDAFYDPDPAAPGKMNTRWGGFLERIDEFDNHFFGISDREAARHRSAAAHAAGIGLGSPGGRRPAPSTLRGSRTGVFVGIAVSEYGMMLSTDLAQTDAHAATGTSLCLAANRLSFAFGLQGPSMALDTACSSSLVAVHLACQSIRNGECDAALAGGVSLILSPIGTVNLTKAGFCAADGRVRAFDAAASGYVRSEGAGLVAA